jgi:hypothetical protein
MQYCSVPVGVPCSPRTDADSAPTHFTQYCKFIQYVLTALVPSYSPPSPQKNNKEKDIGARQELESGPRPGSFNPGSSVSRRL